MRTRKVPGSRQRRIKNKRKRFWMRDVKGGNFRNVKGRGGILLFIGSGL